MIVIKSITLPSVECEDVNQIDWLLNRLNRSILRVLAITGIASDRVADEKVPAYLYDSRLHGNTTVTTSAVSKTPVFHPISYEESHSVGDPFHVLPYNPLFRPNIYRKGHGVIRSTAEKFTGNLHSVSKESQHFWSCLSFGEECIPMNMGLLLH